ncbi:MAG: TraR/DksA C4-type zinc finger protein [Parcubacteria group bacterium]
MREKEAEEAKVAQARQRGVLPTTCGECGCSISEARLKALPGAIRCTDCESVFERERRNRMNFL